MDDIGDAAGSLAALRRRRGRNVGRQRHRRNNERGGTRGIIGVSAFAAKISKEGGENSTASAPTVWRLTWRAWWRAASAPLAGMARYQSNPSGGLKRENGSVGGGIGDGIEAHAAGQQAKSTRSADVAQNKGGVNGEKITLAAGGAASALPL